MTKFKVFTVFVTVFVLLLLGVVSSFQLIRSASEFAASSTTAESAPPPSGAPGIAQYPMSAYIGSSYSSVACTGSTGGYCWNGAAIRDKTNQGIKTTVNVINLAPYTVNLNQISVWASEEMSSHDLWGQIGYISFNGGQVLGFVSIWNNTSGQMLGDWRNWAVSLGKHTFSMYLKSGTTWAFAMDGHVWMTYNMMSKTGGLLIATLVEEYCSNGYSYQFPNIEFYNAISLLQSGAWHATSYGFSDSLGSITPAYGAVGHLQDSVLKADQVIVGTSVKDTSYGTYLWG